MRTSNETSETPANGLTSALGTFGVEAARIIATRILPASDIWVSFESWWAFTDGDVAVVFAGRTDTAWVGRARVR